MTANAMPHATPAVLNGIAHLLGLQPFITYRGPCRTTRMLCNALAVVARGQHVLILGHSTHYTLDLVRNARRMAHTCGFDGGLISAARQDALSIEHVQGCTNDASDPIESMARA